MIAKSKIEKFRIIKGSYAHMYKLLVELQEETLIVNVTLINNAMAISSIHR